MSIRYRERFCDTERLQRALARTENLSEINKHRDSHFKRTCAFVFRPRIARSLTLIKRDVKSRR